MRSTSKPKYQQRNTPIQERSTNTVEAIYEATAQVLVETGLEQFSTDRVAKRTGVSIGILYQYFPNKETLVYSLLDRTWMRGTLHLKPTCPKLGGASIHVLMIVAVDTYVDAKLDHVHLAAALYAAAIETGAAAIVKRISDRCRRALSGALALSTGHLESETDFLAVMIFSAKSEATRAVVRLGATPERVKNLRNYLSLLCCSYVHTWLSEQVHPETKHPWVWNASF